MRKLLIVCDMQNDFLDGVLGFDGYEKVVDSVLELIQKATKEGDMIVYLKDTHGPDYENTIEGKAFPPHCIKGTPGHDLYPLIQRTVGYLPVIEKDTYGSKELLHFLEGNRYDEIVICGLVIDYCVFANAMIAKAAQPNARIIIDTNATASIDPDFAAKCLELIEHFGMEKR